MGLPQNRAGNVMSMAQRSAVLAVARAHGWDQMSVKDVGLLMWAAFHYYVMRLA